MFQNAGILDSDPAVCQVCSQALRVSDAIVTNVHDGEKGLVHRACTVDGVERWQRAGRPHSTPLESARREGWRWADSSPEGGRESVAIHRYTVVRDDGYVVGEYDDWLDGWTARHSAAGRRDDGEVRLYDRTGENGR